ncbi:MAG: hypothetical protein AB7K24_22590, partial [Gemmataceae bacterium]
MKNFLRALRCAWPYRRRLVASVICAALAALFWSLNFTAIYPILKILGNEQSLQQWVDERIDTTQKEVENLQLQVKHHNMQLEAVKAAPQGKFRDREETQLTGSLARLEGK